MIDYHKNIVSALGAILPTHYEMVLNSGLETPCYSYMEINNSTVNNGDNIGYSRITYQVKVWGNDIAVLQNYALKADSALRKLGFTRISTNELYDYNSSMIQKILTFEVLVKEEFKED